MLLYGVDALRARDRHIDEKIGATIRMQRLKKRISQSNLGDAIGVSFQQIQKYESGRNSIAATRIGDLCRVLEISPNDLFGVSAKLRGEAVQFSLSTTKTALKLEKVSSKMHRAIDSILDAALAR
jgi:transcriptional regulator with XRE-family HTH domain